MRGPKSRAGFKAKAVWYPKANTILLNRIPIKTGAWSLVLLFVKIAKIPLTNKPVPINSVKKAHAVPTFCALYVAKILDAVLSSFSKTILS